MAAVGDCHGNSISQFIQQKSFLTSPEKIHELLDEGVSLKESRSVSEQTDVDVQRRNSQVPSDATNKDGFFSRVETYSHCLKWAGKPHDLSPLMCARYGWINVSCDMLKCYSCQAFLCASLQPTVDLEKYHSRVDELTRQLQTQHERFCPWPDCPSPGLGSQATAANLKVTLCPTVSTTTAVTMAAASRGTATSNTTPSSANLPSVTSAALAVISSATATTALAAATVGGTSSGKTTENLLDVARRAAIASNQAANTSQSVVHGGVTPSAGLDEAKEAVKMAKLAADSIPQAVDQETTLSLDAREKIAEAAANASAAAQEALDAAEQFSLDFEKEGADKVARAARAALKAAENIQAQIQAAMSNAVPKNSSLEKAMALAKEAAQFAEKTAIKAGAAGAVINSQAGLDKMVKETVKAADSASKAAGKTLEAVNAFGLVTTTATPSKSTSASQTVEVERTTGNRAALGSEASKRALASAAASSAAAVCAAVAPLLNAFDVLNNGTASKEANKAAKDAAVAAQEAAVYSEEVLKGHASPGDASRVTRKAAVAAKEAFQLVANESTSLDSDVAAMIAEAESPLSQALKNAEDGAEKAPLATEAEDVRVAAAAINDTAEKAAVALAKIRQAIKKMANTGDVDEKKALLKAEQTAALAAEVLDENKKVAEAIVAAATAPREEDRAERLAEAVKYANNSALKALEASALANIKDDAATTSTVSPKASTISPANSVLSKSITSAALAAISSATATTALAAATVGGTSSGKTTENLLDVARRAAIASNQAANTSQSVVHGGVTPSAGLDEAKEAVKMAKLAADSIPQAVDQETTLSLDAREKIAEAAANASAAAQEALDAAEQFSLDFEKEGADKVAHAARAASKAAENIQAQIQAAMSNAVPKNSSLEKAMALAKEAAQFAEETAIKAGAAGAVINSQAGLDKMVKETVKAADSASKAAGKTLEAINAFGLVTTTATPSKSTSASQTVEVERTTGNRAALGSEASKRALASAAASSAAALCAAVAPLLNAFDVLKNGTASKEANKAAKDAAVAAQEAAVYSEEVLKGHASPGDASRVTRKAAVAAKEAFQLVANESTSLDSDVAAMIAEAESPLSQALKNAEDGAEKAPLATEAEDVRVAAAAINDTAEKAAVALAKIRQAIKKMANTGDDDEKKALLKAEQTAALAAEVLDENKKVAEAIVAAATAPREEDRAERLAEAVKYANNSALKALEASAMANIKDDAATTSTVSPKASTISPANSVLSKSITSAALAAISSATATTALAAATVGGTSSGKTTENLLDVARRAAIASNQAANTSKGVVLGGVTPSAGLDEAKEAVKMAKLAADSIPQAVDEETTLSLDAREKIAEAAANASAAAQEAFDAAEQFSLDFEKDGADKVARAARVALKAAENIQAQIQAAISNAVPKNSSLEKAMALAKEAAQFAEETAINAGAAGSVINAQAGPDKMVEETVKAADSASKAAGKTLEAINAFGLVTTTATPSKSTSASQTVEVERTTGNRAALGSEASKRALASAAASSAAALCAAVAPLLNAFDVLNNGTASKEANKAAKDAAVAAQEAAVYSEEVLKGQASPGDASRVTRKAAVAAKEAFQLVANESTSLDSDVAAMIAEAESPLSQALKNAEDGAEKAPLATEAEDVRVAAAAINDTAEKAAVALAKIRQAIKKMANTGDDDEKKALLKAEQTAALAAEVLDENKKVAEAIVAAATAPREEDRAERLAEAVKYANNSALKALEASAMANIKDDAATTSTVSPKASTISPANSVLSKSITSAALAAISSATATTALAAATVGGTSSGKTTENLLDVARRAAIASNQAANTSKGVVLGGVTPSAGLDEAKEAVKMAKLAADSIPQAVDEETTLSLDAREKIAEAAANASAAAQEAFDAAEQFSLDFEKDGADKVARAARVALKAAENIQAQIQAAISNAVPKNSSLEKAMALAKEAAQFAEETAINAGAAGSVINAQAGPDKMVEETVKAADSASKAAGKTLEAINAFGLVTTTATPSKSTSASQTVEVERTTGNRAALGSEASKRALASAAASSAAALCAAVAPLLNAFDVLNNGTASKEANKAAKDAAVAAQEAAVYSEEVLKGHASPGDASRVTRKAAVAAKEAFQLVANESTSLDSDVAAMIAEAESPLSQALKNAEDGAEKAPLATEAEDVRVAAAAINDTAEKAAVALAKIQQAIKKMVNTGDDDEKKALLKAEQTAALAAEVLDENKKVAEAIVAAATAPREEDRAERLAEAVKYANNSALKALEASAMANIKDDAATTSTVSPKASTISPANSVLSKSITSAALAAISSATATTALAAATVGGTSSGNTTENLLDVARRAAIASNQAANTSQGVILGGVTQRVGLDEAKEAVKMAKLAADSIPQAVDEETTLSLDAREKIAEAAANASTAAQEAFDAVEQFSLDFEKEGADKVARAARAALKAAEHIQAQIQAAMSNAVPKNSSLEKAMALAKEAAQFAEETAIKAGAAGAVINAQAGPDKMVEETVKAADSASKAAGKTLEAINAFGLVTTTATPSKSTSASQTVEVERTTGNRAALGSEASKRALASAAASSAAALCAAVAPLLNAFDVLNNGTASKEANKAAKDAAVAAQEAAVYSEEVLKGHASPGDASRVTRKAAVAAKEAFQLVANESTSLDSDVAAMIAEAESPLSQALKNAEDGAEKAPLATEAEDVRVAAAAINDTAEKAAVALAKIQQAIKKMANTGDDDEKKALLKAEQTAALAAEVLDENKKVAEAIVAAATAPREEDRAERLAEAVKYANNSALKALEASAMANINDDAATTSTVSPKASTISPANSVLSKTITSAALAAISSATATTALAAATVGGTSSGNTTENLLDVARRAAIASNQAANTSQGVVLGGVTQRVGMDEAKEAVKMAKLAADSIPQAVDEETTLSLDAREKIAEAAANASAAAQEAFDAAEQFSLDFEKEGADKVARAARAALKAAEHIQAQIQAAMSNAVPKNSSLEKAMALAKEAAQFAEETAIKAGAAGAVINAQAGPDKMVEETVKAADSASKAAGKTLEAINAFGLVTTTATPSKSTSASQTVEVERTTGNRAALGSEASKRALASAAASSAAALCAAVAPLLNAFDVLNNGTASKEANKAAKDAAVAAQEAAVYSEEVLKGHASPGDASRVTRKAAVAAKEAFQLVANESTSLDSDVAAMIAEAESPLSQALKNAEDGAEKAPLATEAEDVRVAAAAINDTAEKAAVALAKIQQAIKKMANTGDDDEKKALLKAEQTAALAAEVLDENKKVAEAIVAAATAPREEDRAERLAEAVKYANNSALKALEASAMANIKDDAATTSTVSPKASTISPANSVLSKSITSAALAAISSATATTALAAATVGGTSSGNTTENLLDVARRAAIASNQAANTSQGVVLGGVTPSAGLDEAKEAVKMAKLAADSIPQAVDEETTLSLDAREKIAEAAANASAAAQEALDAAEQFSLDFEKEGADKVARAARAALMAAEHIQAQIQAAMSNAVPKNSSLEKAMALAKEAAQFAEETAIKAGAAGAVINAQAGPDKMVEETVKAADSASKAAGKTLEAINAFGLVTTTATPSKSTSASQTVEVERTTGNRAALGSEASKRALASAAASSAAALCAAVAPLLNAFDVLNNGTASKEANKAAKDAAVAAQEAAVYSEEVLKGQASPGDASRVTRKAAVAAKEAFQLVANESTSLDSDVAAMIAEAESPLSQALKNAEDGAEKAPLATEAEDVRVAAAAINDTAEKAAVALAKIQQAIKKMANTGDDDEKKALLKAEQTAALAAEVLDENKKVAEAIVAAATAPREEDRAERLAEAVKYANNSALKALEASAMANIKDDAATTSTVSPKASTISPANSVLSKTITSAALAAISSATATTALAAATVGGTSSGNTTENLLDVARRAAIASNQAANTSQGVVLGGVTPSAGLDEAKEAVKMAKLAADSIPQAVDEETTLSLDAREKIAEAAANASAAAQEAFDAAEQFSLDFEKEGADKVARAARAALKAAEHIQAQIQAAMSNAVPKNSSLEKAMALAKEAAQFAEETAIKAGAAGAVINAQAGPDKMVEETVKAADSASKAAGKTLEAINAFGLVTTTATPSKSTSASQTVEVERTTGNRAALGSEASKRALASAAASSAAALCAAVAPLLNAFDVLNNGTASKEANKAAKDAAVAAQEAAVYSEEVLKGHASPGDASRVTRKAAVAAKEAFQLVANESTSLDSDVAAMIAEAESPLSQALKNAEDGAEKAPLATEAEDVRVAAAAINDTAEKAAVALAKIQQAIKKMANTGDDDEKKALLKAEQTAALAAEVLDENKKVAEAIVAAATAPREEDRAERLAEAVKYANNSALKALEASAMANIKDDAATTSTVSPKASTISPANSVLSKSITSAALAAISSATATTALAAATVGGTSSGNTTENLLDVARRAAIASNQAANTSQGVVLGGVTPSAGLDEAKEAVKMAKLAADSIPQAVDEETTLSLDAREKIAEAAANASAAAQEALDAAEQFSLDFEKEGADKVARAARAALMAAEHIQAQIQAAMSNAVPKNSSLEKAMALAKEAAQFAEETAIKAGAAGAVINAQAGPDKMVEETVKAADSASKAAGKTLEAINAFGLVTTTATPSKSTSASQTVEVERTTGNRAALGSEASKRALASAAASSAAALCAAVAPLLNAFDVLNNGTASKEANKAAKDAAVAAQEAAVYSEEVLKGQASPGDASRVTRKAAVAAKEAFQLVANESTSLDSDVAAMIAEAESPLSQALKNAEDGAEKAPLATEAEDVRVAAAAINDTAEKAAVALAKIQQAIKKMANTGDDDEKKALLKAEQTAALAAEVLDENKKVAEAIVAAATAPREEDRAERLAEAVKYANNSALKALEASAMANIKDDAATTSTVSPKASTISPANSVLSKSITSAALAAISSATATTALAAATVGGTSSGNTTENLLDVARRAAIASNQAANTSQGVVLGGVTPSAGLDEAKEAVKMAKLAADSIPQAVDEETTLSLDAREKIAEAAANASAAAQEALDAAEQFSLDFEKEGADKVARAARAALMAAEHIQAQIQAAMSNAVPKNSSLEKAMALAKEAAQFAEETAIKAGAAGAVINAQAGPDKMVEETVKAADSASKAAGKTLEAINAFGLVTTTATPSKSTSASQTVEVERTTGNRAALGSEASKRALASAAASSAAALCAAVAPLLNAFDVLNNGTASKEANKAAKDAAVAAQEAAVYSEEVLKGHASPGDASRVTRKAAVAAKEAFQLVANESTSLDSDVAAMIAEAESPLSQALKNAEDGAEKAPLATEAEDVRVAAAAINDTAEKAAVALAKIQQAIKKMANTGDDDEKKALLKAEQTAALAAEVLDENKKVAEAIVAAATAPREEDRAERLAEAVKYANNSALKALEASAMANIKDDAATTSTVSPKASTISPANSVLSKTITSAALAAISSATATTALAAATVGGTSSGNTTENLLDVARRAAIASNQAANTSQGVVLGGVTQRVGLDEAKEAVKMAKLAADSIPQAVDEETTLSLDAREKIAEAAANASAAAQEAFDAAEQFSLDFEKEGADKVARAARAALKAAEHIQAQIQAAMSNAVPKNSSLEKAMALAKEAAQFAEETAIKAGAAGAVINAQAGPDKMVEETVKAADSASKAAGKTLEAIDAFGLVSTTATTTVASQHSLSRSALAACVSSAAAAASSAATAAAAAGATSTAVGATSSPVAERAIEAARNTALIAAQVANGTTPPIRAAQAAREAADLAKSAAEVAQAEARTNLNQNRRRKREVFSIELLPLFAAQAAAASDKAANATLMIIQGLPNAINAAQTASENVVVNSREIADDLELELSTSNNLSPAVRYSIYAAQATAKMSEATATTAVSATVNATTVELALIFAETAKTTAGSAEAAATAAVASLPRQVLLNGSTTSTPSLISENATVALTTSTAAAAAATAMAASTAAAIGVSDEAKKAAAAAEDAALASTLLAEGRLSPFSAAAAARRAADEAEAVALAVAGVAAVRPTESVKRIAQATSEAASAARKAADVATVASGGTADAIVQVKAVAETLRNAANDTLSILKIAKSQPDGLKLTAIDEAEVVARMVEATAITAETAADAAAVNEQELMVSMSKAAAKAALSASKAAATTIVDGSRVSQTTPTSENTALLPTQSPAKARSREAAVSAATAAAAASTAATATAAILSGPSVRDAAKAAVLAAKDAAIASKLVGATSMLEAVEAAEVAAEAAQVAAQAAMEEAARDPDSQIKLHIAKVANNSANAAKNAAAAAAAAAHSKITQQSMASLQKLAKAVTTECEVVNQELLKIQAEMGEVKPALDAVAVSQMAYATAMTSEAAIAGFTGPVIVPVTTVVQLADAAAASALATATAAEASVNTYTGTGSGDGSGNGSGSSTGNGTDSGSGNGSDSGSSGGSVSTAVNNRSSIVFVSIVAVIVSSLLH